MYSGTALESLAGISDMHPYMAEFLMRYQAPITGPDGLQYEARAYGVRTPMGVDRALRLCPGAVVVAARFSAYAETSKAVFGRSGSVDTVILREID